MRKTLVFLFAAALTTLWGSPTAHAAEFQWQTADGEVQRLADYRGKPLLLHFWASWCPPCRAEMPELVAWREAHGDVTLIPVSLDRNAEQAAAFLRSEGFDLPTLHGDTRQASQLGVRGLPTTLVIDADGEILRVMTGARAWGDAEFSDALLHTLKPGDRSS